LRPSPTIVQSGADGSYNFVHVAPGKYRLLASDDGYAIGHEEDLEDVGEIVEVAEQQAVVKDVKKYVLPGRR
jgi:hypothetical protein